MTTSPADHRTVPAVDLQPGMYVRTCTFNNEPVWLPVADQPRWNTRKDALWIRFDLPPQLHNEAPRGFWAKPRVEFPVSHTPPPAPQRVDEPARPHASQPCSTPRRAAVASTESALAAKLRDWRCAGQEALWPSAGVVR